MSATTIIDTAPLGALKRFYRQMLCAHAARQAAGDSLSG